MPLWTWSRTSAGANGGADPGINFLENQAPSSLNDSARALMQATAQYRDDVAGGTVTTGASQAYSLSTFSNFTSAAALANQMVAFTPHVTNGATVTISIDSVANIPLRSSPGVELPAGVLIAGTPYCCTYNNTDGALYLQSFYGNPYNVPISAGFDYWGPTAPNSSFAFPIGQAISRTTYSSLFAGNPWSIGTIYGVGDGSTTFNLPDKTDRVSVMKAATATRLTTAGSGVDGGTLGATGGAQNEVIAQANLPNVNFVVAAGQTVSATGNIAFGSGGAGASGVSLNTANSVNSMISTGTVTSTGTAASGGSGTPLTTVMPTIVCNYVIRII